MIEKIKFKGFKAIPWLETSSLWKTHARGGIKFVSGKPNVVIGPNGSGKSALMTALAYLTLSYFSGRSNFDGNFSDTKALWTEGEKWYEKPEFLTGLEFTGVIGPSTFFRPGMLPGDDSSLCAAMMCGYWSEARKYGELTDKLSSGQGVRNLLAEALNPPDRFGFVNWNHTKEPVEKPDSWRYQSNELLKRYAGLNDNQKMILLDEPEQSLDALNEIALWNDLREKAKTHQVIVATHSIMPILRPQDYNLIETTKGYAKLIQENV